MADEPLGPFLVAAALCERILDERDGVPSLIRIIDRVTLTIETEMPEGGTTSPYFLSFYIKFASAGLSAERTLNVKMINPLGEETKLLEHPVVFQPDKSGFSFRINMGLGFKREGLYWVFVYLEDTLFTQVPLRVEFRIEESGSSGSQMTEQP